jgi:DNA-binding NtrC family response regulator
MPLRRSVVAIKHLTLLIYNVSASSAIASSRILVIDDVPEFCQEMRTLLKPHCSSVVICRSPLRGLRMLTQSSFDLVITTLVMKELGGFELIRRLRGQGSRIPIVMITGYGDQNTSIEATRLGVSDYLEKPVNPKELLARLGKLLGNVRQPEAFSDTQRDGLISEDSAMKSIFDMIETVARSDSRVLILGETGTGKQLVAQSLHSHSTRAAEPFVEINCAAIPANLLESELFGHGRGAFTGATERRIGRFEEAGAGTIFLDEIGEIGFELQSKLLRVLQSGKFNRVGETKTLQSHARVVAATNRDLLKEIEVGRFRADLFYRLHVISLTLPPLRKRSQDIPLLAGHFLKRYRGRRSFPVAFTPDALRRMQLYRWPGNVRELEHLVERFAVLHGREWIETTDLPDHIFRETTSSEGPNGGIPLRGTYAEAKAVFERQYLEHTLRAARGNIAAAARQAGMNRSHYFRMVHKHHLDPHQLGLTTQLVSAGP